MSSFRVPQPENEPVRSYAPGSPDHAALQAALAALKQRPLELPLVIGGKAVTTGKRIAITAPHNHELVLGHYHQGGVPEIKAAVAAALKAQRTWIHLYITNIGAGTVTIDGNASETIASTETISIIQWESAQIVDYASGAWAIV